MKNKHLLLWIAAVFMILSRAALGVDVTARFFPTPPGYIICNGQKQPGNPASCSFVDNKIEVGTDTWGGHASTFTLTSTNPPTVEISGDCKDSWGRNNLDFNPSPVCQPKPIDPPPTAKGALLFDEWFTDLPWHQKLSTKDSNLIDVPFVLPAAAIKNCQNVSVSPDKERCMLRYGIINVMAMHRTDTLYLPGDVPDSYNQDCADGKCVQVKLDIQRIHSTDTVGYAADPVTNNSYDNSTIPSLGFAITESTIFAPWHPWYMGHYCAVNQDHVSDSVCYEDYFTTQLIAATDLSGGEIWLKDRPALFYPQSPNDSTKPGSQFGHWCATTQDINNPKPCSMYLGKVKFNDNLTTPQIDNCDPTTCLSQVNAKTQSLDEQFKKSLSQFTDIGRYPWKGPQDANAFDSISAYLSNPFIGYYEMTQTRMDGDNYLFKATSYALPKQCTQQDFADARLKGDPAAIARLKDCSLNFEIHTNGFYDIWKDLYGGAIDDKAISEIRLVFNKALDTNQYGRTMFLFAGVPEQMIPVSLIAAVPGGQAITTHEKIYGSSLYTQYLPLVNPNDQTQASKEYQDDFWHSILMSNHMNQDPDHFIRGIRGRTLWHNEYRSNLLYKAEEIDKKTGGTQFAGPVLAHVDFPAGFQKNKHTSPYHGNTCDACHIRNGSGVPLMPNGKLSALQISRGMNPTGYQLFPAGLDYTHTNPNVPPLKLVLFDLNGIPNQCDAIDHTVSQPFYSNKYMNFYGNSFHVNQSPQNSPTYTMEYVPVNSSDGFFLVDATERKSADNNAYLPQRPHLISMDTGTGRCNELATLPKGISAKAWPASCAEVDGSALKQAIENGEIGIMHLLGKRLGNSPLIEMVPDAKIKANVLAQRSAFSYAGCYGQVAGTRVGTDGAVNYRSCGTPPTRTPRNSCYISRWGWIGDRASLEDQIANAAHVEMNISTKDGFNRIHPNQKAPLQQVRYNQTLCGPADLTCQNSSPNSDITEEEVRNMATYQRWIGIPNRSRYQISTTLVQQGEKQFRDLGCASCHVIDKIPFVEKDNMLPDEERAALKKLQDKTGQVSDYPFVSYLGTDLLMHDMGYLSQLAKAPAGAGNFRNADGTINSAYAGYIQKIRTPPLKGLRFNRFVTDSNHNTTSPIRKDPDKAIIPGCDFLLHDGRACDAIEAAFLHDGPAVKQLGMINKLGNLNSDQLTALRAFLYSL